MDQRGEASGEDDAPELPSILAQRSSVVAQHSRLQHGQPVAAAGAAERNRNMVVDQPTAPELYWDFGEGREEPFVENAVQSGRRTDDFTVRYIEAR